MAKKVVKKKPAPKPKRVRIVFDEEVRLADGAVIKEIMATIQEVPPGKPTGG